MMKLYFVGGKQEMIYILHTKRFKSLVAGALAAIMLALPLVGCGQNVITAGSSQPQVSSAQSRTASQPASSTGGKQSSGTVSSTASSTASAQVSSAAKASSAAAVKLVKNAVVKKTPATKVETGNKAVKKIAADQSTQNTVRLSVTKSTAPVKQGYTHIDQRGGYNYLTDAVSRSLYNQMLQSVYKVSVTPTSQGYYPTERITVAGSHLTEAELRLALLAFINDNPQVFWLANVYSYGYSDSETYVQLYSVVPQNECNSMIQQLNQKVNAAVTAMPAGLSELDRELYLFHYLAKTCVYDYSALTDSSLWKPFAAYGALVDGKAVCEGYSRAMQLLSSYAGLQSMLITGQSDGVNHMWNLMNINGNWYHLDTTWGDSDVPVYNFFNLTDSVVTQTHSIFPSASTLTAAQIDGTDGSAAQCNLALPSCTATEANYFKAKGIPISDLNGTNDSAVIAALSAAAKAKKDSFSFYVNESADFDQTLSGLVSSSPYKIVSYISTVNSESGMVNQIDLGKIKYISDAADRGITIYLSYK
jgi:hypothetical protein